MKKHLIGNREHVEWFLSQRKFSRGNTEGRALVKLLEGCRTGRRCREHRCAKCRPNKCSDCNPGGSNVHLAYKYHIPPWDVKEL